MLALLHHTLSVSVPQSSILLCDRVHEHADHHHYYWGENGPVFSPKPIQQTSNCLFSASLLCALSNHSEHEWAISLQRLILSGHSQGHWGETIMSHWSSFLALAVDSGLGGWPGKPRLALIHTWSQPSKRKFKPHMLRLVWEILENETYVKNAGGIFRTTSELKSCMSANIKSYCLSILGTIYIPLA